jgi:hypothetical protein
MSFDSARLYSLTRDIEKYLGYLKGNELIRQYTDAQIADVEEQILAMPEGGFANMFRVSEFYTSTPQDSEFTCDFSALFIMAPFDNIGEASAERTAYFGQIGDGLRQSWENGAVWASGMGADLRAICEPFTSPDPASLNEIAKAFQTLSGTRLASLLPDDFAAHSDGRNFGSTLDGWHGDSANTFQSFYDTLADRGNGYAVCVGLAAGWVSGTAGLIAAAQTGLLDFLESVRDGLVIQLEEWVATYGNPQDWRRPDDWGIIGDIAGVALDIADLIPVVDKFRKVPGVISDIAGLIKDVNTVVTKVDGYVGGGDVPKVEARTEFNVRTAEELYRAATTVLHDEILHELNKGLDDLAAESRLGIRMISELQTGGDWLPHQVGANNFNTPWTHYSDI